MGLGRTGKTRRLNRCLSGFQQFAGNLGPLVLEAVRRDGDVRRAGTNSRRYPRHPPFGEGMHGPRRRARLSIL